MRIRNTEMKYDYLIVGAGLYGAVFAERKASMGKRVLVIDRRDHIAGNTYSETIEGIEVHKYGPHIFHTDKEEVWEYVNRFADFNHFTYCPVANYKGELYNLPFNMNTFTKMWPDVKTPEQAETRIRLQREEFIRDKLKEQEKTVPADLAGLADRFEPYNLEEQAISLVGRDIYEKLIKGYTEKQWGRPCTELPAFIIKRLPVRFTFDNNYFNHPHQGIPIGGYTRMVARMLGMDVGLSSEDTESITRVYDGSIEVRLNEDYLSDRVKYNDLADTIIYTGQIDEYYDYRFGALQYRSLRFETEILDTGNYQGIAGMNFTDAETPFTRIVEHKHFEFGNGNPDKTVITREYSQTWKQDMEAYYPVNDVENAALYEKYRLLAEQESHIRFGGRLGTYRYMDMDQVIRQAMYDAKE